MKKLVVGLLIVCGIGMISGCSGDRPVAGGTRGTLRNATAALCDVRIDVYPAGASAAIGFAVTTDGGNFELYQPDAKGALYLEPGDYSFTLESMGPEPVALPPAFRDPRQTPLRKQWQATDSILELTVP